MLYSKHYSVHNNYYDYTVYCYQTKCILAFVLQKQKLFNTAIILYGIVKFLALMGSRSSPSRMLKDPLADYMQRKGYKFEEKLIRTVANWRCACDEHGLTELQQCKFNYQLLNLLLDDLML